MAIFNKILERLGRRIWAESQPVLLVEDSSGDVRLTREALKDAKMHINLHVASDGAEAMAFLGREGEFANAPRPDLILLDLNLPKKDGGEVLEEIKESPTLKSIPVVILTTSASLLVAPSRLAGVRKTPAHRCLQVE